ncbi:MAG TPA: enoyl-CoA hydratase-related protein [Acidimicrobiia bacterium]|nr:enoyl-CoA hydratase-related protein [Acidimicrobiia bacterium]
MSAYENVLLDVRDGVAHLTLDRPEAANGIDAGMAQDLMAATVEIGLDDRVRAVLLSGSGARFCGGGDVKAFAALGDDLPAHIRGLIPALHTAITSLVRGDAPVVAAVHGSAAGAGLGLVGASDLVVAGESTRFVMAYTGVGLTPDGSSSWFIPRLVGLRRALELTLTNRVLTAEEARDWGIVTTVVPDDDVMGTATALAERLADGPRAAQAAAKRLLHTSLEESLETHLAREADAIVAAAATDESNEGLNAFVEKRAPGYR